MRKDLKGRFTDPASYELATIGGTELVVILRADAANAQTARSVVDLAISSCAPAPASGPGA